MEVSFDVITLPSEGMSIVAWRVYHAFIDGMAAQLLFSALSYGAALVLRD